jgi:hypothetical protein
MPQADMNPVSGAFLIRELVFRAPNKIDHEVRHPTGCGRLQRSNGRTS